VILRSSLFRRLALAMALLALLPVAATAVWSFLLLRAEARAQAEERLRAEAVVAREAAIALFKAGDRAALDALAKRLASSAESRVTFIAADGTVLGDSTSDPVAMANHASRPEVKAARESGLGVHVRVSETVGQELVYVAVRADPGDPASGTIRAALAVETIQARLRGAYLRIAAVATPVALAALVSVWLGLSVLARAVDELTRAATSVAKGGAPLRTEAAERDDEVGSLARAVHGMAEELERRVRTSARERNELATIVAGVGEGLIAVDAQGRILLFNAAAVRLFGLAAAPRTGTPLVDAVLDGEVAELARATVASAKEGGRRIEVRSAPMTEPRSVEARATPFGESPERPAGAVVLLHDVTEAERYDKLRRDFVANVSHELRTPLALVKGFLETLEDGAVSDPVHGPRFLGILRRHVDGLERLVADLLTLSTLESGAEESPAEPVDVGGAIEAVLAPFADVLERRRVTVATAVAEDLPPASAPRARVERAVRNLVDNAVKFAPEGGRLSIAARLAAGGERVEVTVKDDGPGIPPEDQPRIFERFYRVEKSRNRGAGGTGLGLAIVKHIMQQAGGSVSVESEVGQGSAFTLSFPRWKGA